MNDDPRDILKAAGVECAELEEYLNEGQDETIILDGPSAAILALARLVAQYKWQREIQVVGALDYNGAIARLDELWESHLREQ